MLITRETDYAIRALRALARGGKQTLGEMCEYETIPQPFGYKILKKLAKAGYVTILRGKNGGYVINEAFKTKTMLDLTKIMENPTDVSPCVAPGYRCESHANALEPCPINASLAEVQRKLNIELNAINLYDILTA